MKNELLTKLYKSNTLPSSIKEGIYEVLNEQEEYAADELVSLSEIILLNLSALAIASYLTQKNQLPPYNDFLLGLFTSKSHSYNAGPIYRWAANMIKDLDDDTSKKLAPFFWSKNKNQFELNSEIHSLALLRNEVMHGFFILPAERNHKEAQHIAEILNDLIKNKVFELYKFDAFHFLSFEKKLTQFKGEWGIDDNNWKILEKCNSFGLLSKQIKYELSNEFDEAQKKLVDEHADDMIDKRVKKFINDNNQGALAIWSRPNENSLINFSNTVKYIENQELYLPIFYSLNPQGLNFTDIFLLNKLVKQLATDLNIEKYNKDPKKALKQLLKKSDKKPIVIINNIHLCLFASNHLVNLVDFLYQNNILLISFGIQYRWLNQFFNDSISFSTDAYIPNNKIWEADIKNYLRYKVSIKNINSQESFIDSLSNVIKDILKEFKKSDKIFARRFADEHGYAIEYVHEAFNFLFPYLKFTREPFELDEVDDLYGFPKQINESSRVYFSIGRRDAKLEYQHLILSK